MDYYDFLRNFHIENFAKKHTISSLGSVCAGNEGVEVGNFELRTQPKSVYGHLVKQLVN